MFCINEYSFGHIVVNNKHYYRDIIILPDYIIDNWWRKSGHLLILEDIKRYIEPYLPIEILVVGMGEYSMMKIDNSVYNYLEERNIKLFALNTKEAVRVYNENKSKKIIGCFHLTC